MTAQLIHLSEHGAMTENDRRLIQQTVQNGGLIVFPTDTIYGLGCDAFQSDAIDRIYRLKDRRSDQRPTLRDAHDSVPTPLKRVGVLR